MPGAAEKFSEALQALDQAEFEAAIECLGHVVMDDPQNAEAWAHLGLCYLETGQGQRALEALNRAVKTDSSSAQNQYLLGVAHGATGSFERALSCFQQALKIDPSHVKAEEFRVRTESLLESRQHYRQALELLKQKPTADYASRALREILISLSIFEESPARQELPFCVRELQKNLHDVYHDLDLSYQFQPFFEACEQGYQAIRLMSWQSARAAYDQAAGMREEPFVLHGLALAAFNTGDSETAIRIWRMLLQFDPEFDFGALGRLRLPGPSKPNGGPGPTTSSPSIN